MSVTCYLILQLKSDDEKVLEKAISEAPFYVERPTGEYLLLPYEGHRFNAFEELPEEVQSLEIASYVGEDLLQFSRDSRGVYVESEVGVPYRGKRYKDVIAAGSGFFVRLLPNPSGKKLARRADESDTAISAILRWVEVARQREPARAKKIMECVMLAKWAELALITAAIPELAEFSKMLTKAKKKG